MADFASKRLQEIVLALINDCTNKEYVSQLQYLPAKGKNVQDCWSRQVDHLLATVSSIVTQLYSPLKRLNAINRHLCLQLLDQAPARSADLLRILCVSCMSLLATLEAPYIRDTVRVSVGNFLQVISQAWIVQPEHLTGVETTEILFLKDHLSIIHDYFWKILKRLILLLGSKCWRFASFIEGYVVHTLSWSDCEKEESFGCLRCSVYQCLTALLQTAQDLHKEHRDLIIEHLQKDLQSSTTGQSLCAAAIECLESLLQNVILPRNTKFKIFQFLCDAIERSNSRVFLEKLVECVMESLDHNPVPSLAVPLQTLRTKCPMAYKMLSRRMAQGRTVRLIQGPLLNRASSREFPSSQPPPVSSQLPPSAPHLLAPPHWPDTGALITPIIPRAQSRTDPVKRDDFEVIILSDTNDEDDSWCQEPATSVGGPTTSVGGPTTSVGGPTTSVGGPTTSVGGPTTSVGGPTTSIGGSTTTVGGPTTSVGGPTTSDGGPTTSENGDMETNENNLEIMLSSFSD